MINVLGQPVYSFQARFLARVTGKLAEVVSTTPIQTKASRNGRQPKARDRVFGNKLATKALEGSLGSRNGKGFLKTYRPWQLNLGA